MEGLEETSTISPLMGPSSSGAASLQRFSDVIRPLHTNVKGKRGWKKFAHLHKIGYDCDLDSIFLMPIWDLTAGRGNKFKPRSSRSSPLQSPPQAKAPKVSENVDFAVSASEPAKVAQSARTTEQQRRMGLPRRVSWWQNSLAPNFTAQLLSQDVTGCHRPVVPSPPGLEEAMKRETAWPVIPSSQTHSQAPLHES